MNRYVCGFLFNKAKTEVLLIQKKRPEWQYGLLNGLGGRIEVFESSLQAMIREFKEESGYTFDEWERFCELRVGDSQVSFYRGFIDQDLYTFCSSPTDEKVAVYSLYDLDYLECVPNLSWLIPLALTDNQVRADIIMR
jgi:8-oxo-dGTP diphosphatase